MNNSLSMLLRKQIREELVVYKKIFNKYKNANSLLKDLKSMKALINS